MNNEVFVTAPEGCEHETPHVCDACLALLSLAMDAEDAAIEQGALLEAE